MQFDEAVQNFMSIGILKCIPVSKYSEIEKVKTQGKTPRASGARAVIGKWGTFANDFNSNGSGRVKKRVEG